MVPTDKLIKSIMDFEAKMKALENKIEKESCEKSAFEYFKMHKVWIKLTNLIEMELDCF